MNDNKELKIALAFSGGGYRAAAFNLGVLSYLNNVKLDGRPILEYVSVLSTISGGTITGLKYAAGIKKGDSLKTIYSELYTFMSHTDLVSLALERLISRKGWTKNRIKSLINAFADIYDKYLFYGEKFGMLQNSDPPIHLKHISFNATEFAYALPFRFQWTDEYQKVKAGESKRGIFGNHYLRLPEDLTAEIRLADILAASSCFPAGFEPINFPTDFVLPDDVKNRIGLLSKEFPVGLMDGGIVDNQGIGPILLVEERMQRDVDLDPDRDNEEHVLDLIIISDVASPFMERYKASKQKKKNLIRNLTPTLVFSIMTFLFAVSGFVWIYAKIHSLITILVLSSFVLSLCLFTFFVTVKLPKLLRKFHVPEQFFKPLKKLLRLKFFVYENLIMNRVNSVLKMTNDVFMKHIRRLNYKRIYEDKTWRNRRIMNAIYELSTRKGKFKLKPEEQEDKMGPFPGSQLQEIADAAFSMGTTLWYTEDELKSKMLDKLIACGQFTICWNLMDYINSIRKDDFVNTSENTKMLTTCESDLKKDWKKFNDNPYWLVDDYNKSTNQQITRSTRVEGKH